MTHNFKITSQEKGRTIFKYLLKVFANVPRSKLEKLMRTKSIKINNKRIQDKSYILQEFDEVIIYGIDQLNENNLKDDKQHIKLLFKKVYEDENILIVDKPKNLSIHDDKNSLDRQVLHYLRSYTTVSFSPTHVHRIDKEASGIVVYAKNFLTAKQLKLKINQQEKIYVFKSSLNEDITTKFKMTHNEKLQKVVISKYGTLTHTKFFVKNKIKYAQIFTGHKHQIRVSLSHLNHPIVGDRKYGGITTYRLFLHSYKFVFHNLEQELKYLNNKKFVCPAPW